jgi:hypothetical protein
MSLDEDGNMLQKAADWLQNNRNSQPGSLLIVRSLSYIKPLRNPSANSAWNDDTPRDHDFNTSNKAVHNRQD